MDKVITCINCPVGCRMTVSLAADGSFVSVTGNTCPRGAVYAKQECTEPLRVITAVIPVSGSNLPLSVKTSGPVPKEKIAAIMQVLGDVSVTAPVSAGDVIVPDVLGTSADIIATRSVAATHL